MLWPGAGSGGAAGVASVGRGQGCTVLDTDGFSQLQNGPSAGHSQAHQQSWWCLCGSSRGTPRSEEEEEVLQWWCRHPTITKGVAACGGYTHTHPGAHITHWRDCGQWVSPCWSRYTPKQTAACGGATPECRKSVRRREQQREISVSQLHTPPTTRCLSEGTECNLQ